MTSQAKTLVDYYRQNRFNPVPIDLGSPQAIADHTAKRRNLYEGHLGVPLGLLRGQEILEFGCNSGENALVLARYGANLTLVEPNEQAHDRLVALFQAHGLAERLRDVVCCGVQDYPEAAQYDMVLAEGFLYSLPDKAEMLAKLCRLVKPGGLGIVSFNCRFGGLIELHKRLALYRACEISGAGFHSEQSLALAEAMFGKAFANIKASRTLAAWWKDLLIVPFYSDRHLWSYDEVLPIVAQGGGELLSTSPRWFMGESFRWYKDVPAHGERLKAAIGEWERLFGSMLTGKAAPSFDVSASREVIGATAALVLGISDYTEGVGPLSGVVVQPVLSHWFAGAKDPNMQALAKSLTALHAALPLTDPSAFLQAVEASGLATLWGSPYHYVSWLNNPSQPSRSAAS